MVWVYKYSSFCCIAEIVKVWGLTLVIQNNKVFKWEKYSFFMEQSKIESLFGRASKLNENEMGYVTKEELSNIRFKDGIKRFKLAALGKGGYSSVRTLEEMAKLLHETGVVSSLDEGKAIVPSLVGVNLLFKSGGLRESIRYGNGMLITFEEVMKPSCPKEKRYNICMKGCFW